MITASLRLARKAAFPVVAAGLAACMVQAIPQATAGPAPAAADAVNPTGSWQQTADLGGIPLQVFGYRPSGCTVSAVLLVFHGLDRNAGPYRDDAIPLAQRYCMLVVAPLFDEARFPTWRYQRGGIIHDGAVQPAANWTVTLVPHLVEWARERAGRPDLPYALLGHSAGAQFLSRVAAFGQGGATRIVIANPSTWVEPTLDVAAPYGLGGVYGPAQGEAALRRYLALPITVLLGRADTGSHNLATSEEAEEQGSTRFERGQKVFRDAELAARQRGWAFNWHLVVVLGVGHSARQMFTSDAAFDALQPGTDQTQAH